MVAEIQELEEQVESFSLHFEWKGKASVMECENLLKAKVARMMLAKQGVESYITDAEED